MRIALVTTTIHVPEVLGLYRTFGPDVQMFVAADDKTPSEAYWTLSEVGAVVCKPHTDDDKWKCSPLIGRNTIGRRSIAILEALRWGAEAIVSIDDDNIPMNEKYFYDFRYALMPGVGWSGLLVKVPGKDWVDQGQWLVPPAEQRGTPAGLQVYGPDNISFMTGAKVGVAQGICLGDPDTSAIDRISRRPDVHQVSQLLHSGVVVHPEARAVFNTQNTAFVRELAPCFLMVPQFGRHDDIYASLICRRVMRETGHYLHLGKPFVWQTRNNHNLLTDLKAELWGMEHVIEFADWLDKITWQPDLTVLERVRYIYQCFENTNWMPGVSELGLAWCQDIETVL